MNYRLIAFDLDGTLLDSEKRIPAENIAALRRAAEKGAYIVPATGRILGGIPEELSALPFIRYYVCINGAAVMDAQTGRRFTARRYRSTRRCAFTNTWTRCPSYTTAIRMAAAG